MDDRRVALRLHATLEPVVSTDELVCASVGPANEVMALWSVSASPASARITRHAPATTLLAESAAMPLSHPTIQPLPGDRTLIVGSRCAWQPEGPEKNAIILDASGSVVAEGTLGDGINHLLTTPSGAIWVGYFDEGVYGSFGWEGPGSPPIGQPGIVRFDESLQVGWSFPFNDALPVVDDCYALNVDGEHAWACYYSAFPIVRLGEASAVWTNEVAGAHALLVEGTTAALLGGSSGERDRVAVGNLSSSGAFDVTRTVQLTMPDGAPPPASTVIARGADLHVLVGNAWLRQSLDDLASG